MEILSALRTGIVGPGGVLTVVGAWFGSVGGYRKEMGVLRTRRRGLLVVMRLSVQRKRSCSHGNGGVKMTNFSGNFSLQ